MLNFPRMIFVVDMRELRSELQLQVRTSWACFQVSGCQSGCRLALGVGVLGTTCSNTALSKVLLVLVPTMLTRLPSEESVYDGVCRDVRDSCPLSFSALECHRDALLIAFPLVLAMMRCTSKLWNEVESLNSTRH
jgi:hypothetical protein